MIDRHFTFYRRLQTDEPPEQVYAEIEQALRTTVGGSIQRIDSVFHIQNGINNLSFSFVGDLSATVSVSQPSAGVVDLNGTITLRPNALFWISAVTGALCLWFMWLMNLMYFILDPRVNYQAALDRIQIPTSGEPITKQYG